MLAAVKTLYVWLQVVFADRAYDRVALLATCFTPGLTLAIVRSADGAVGFQLIPRRWVVERTFGRTRCLSKDDEELPEVSEGMITLAAIRTMLQRLTSTDAFRNAEGDFKTGSDALPGLEVSTLG